MTGKDIFWILVGAGLMVGTVTISVKVKSEDAGKAIIAIAKAFSPCVLGD